MPDKGSDFVRRVLITGGAGFIGSHLADRLLTKGTSVCVVDNFHPYYAPAIKRQNIAAHLDNSLYQFIEGDIRDDTILSRVFSSEAFDTVVHLANLAGVRPSLLQPEEYMDVNVRGTQKLLSYVRKHPSTRFVFGSSSSVYGIRGSKELFLEQDRVDRPISPYGASKAAAELACYAAHQCWKIPMVCLRFFTVYGPRQRPDLAIHKFCQLIDQGKTIEVYGDGSTMRDYTFVNDTVSGIEAALKYDCPGFDIINLGRGEPVRLTEMIDCLEASLGKKAHRVLKPQQAGDVPYTHASIEKAGKLLGYKPSTSIKEGIARFVEWYKATKKIIANV